MTRFRLVCPDPTWAWTDPKGQIWTCSLSAVGTGTGLLIGILILCVFGALVVWLAGLVGKGSGCGLLGDVIVGIVGANVAGWLFPAIGIPVGNTIVGAIVVAVLGAVILLLVNNRSGGRWRNKLAGRTGLRRD